MSSLNNSFFYGIDPSIQSIDQYYNVLKSRYSNFNFISLEGVSLYSLERSVPIHDSNYSDHVIKYFNADDSEFTDYQLQQIEACKDVARSVFAFMFFNEATKHSVYAKIDTSSLERDCQSAYGEHFQFPVKEFLQSMNEYEVAKRELFSNKQVTIFRGYYNDADNSIQLLFNDIKNGIEESHSRLHNKYYQGVLKKQPLVDSDFEKFNQWRKRNQFTDLNVGIEDPEDPENMIQFPIHRMILAHQSSFFDSLFSNEIMQSKPDSIEFPEVNPAAFSAFLDLVYRNFSEIKRTSLGQLEELLELSIRFECIEVQVRLLKEIMERSDENTNIDLLMRIIETSNGLEKGNLEDKLIGLFQGNRFSEREIKFDCEDLLSRLCYLGNARCLLDFAIENNLSVLASVCHYHLNITSDEIDELVIEADAGNVEAQKRLVEYYREKGDYTTYQRLMKMIEGDDQEPEHHRMQRIDFADDGRRGARRSELLLAEANEDIPVLPRGFEGVDVEEVEEVEYVEEVDGPMVRYFGPRRGFRHFLLADEGRADEPLLPEEYEGEVRYVGDEHFLADIEME